MDDYRIDSHKLIYQIDSLYDWLRGRNVCPLYLEISPVNICNHNCVFCGLDYLKNDPILIKKKYMLKAISGMAACGVKSVMFAGEGEPLLHDNIAEFINAAKNKRLDVALTTNGALLNKAISSQIVKSLSWLRVSLDAGNPETYSRLHSCRPSDFNRVLDNIAAAVEIRKRTGSGCTIGGQLVFLQENENQVVKLARTLKKAGADYLIIKPYSQHPLSKKKISYISNKADQAKLKLTLDKVNSRDFQVIFRDQAFVNARNKKPYSKCFGLAFWSYLDSSGQIYACSSFLGDKRFIYGSIYKNSFRDIMKGKRRSRLLKIFCGDPDLSGCRLACRMDEVNRYLWDLKYPGKHVNFI